MKNWGFYEWSIVLLFVVVPCAGTWIEAGMLFSVASVKATAFKWLVFSGIGLRLLGAGAKQLIQPRFTAEEIFRIDGGAAVPVVRELGLANLCFAFIGILSFFVPVFRVPAAVAGGLYYGLAGLLHVVGSKDSGKEIFAMVSDLYICAMLLLLLILTR